MSIGVLTNAKLYLAQYDLSSELNAIATDMSAESPETTTFGNTAKTRAGGLVDTKISLNGYFNSEQVIFNSLALSNIPMTTAPTGTDGENCFLFRPVLAKYTLGGKVGDVYPYKVEAEGSGPFISGTILLPKSAKTSTNTGTGRQIGACGATQTVYGILHVFSATAGPDTLDVVIQSDAANTFLSPTDVITFGQKTAVGYEWKTALASVPGADTWWRVSFTIGGVDPSFTFMVGVGFI